MKLQILVSIVIISLHTRSLSAQVIQFRGSNSDSVAARMNAQASMMKAQGERERLLAEARVQYAISEQELVKAASMKADLDLKLMRTYWKKKEEWHINKMRKLEESLENRRKPMIKDRARKASVYEKAFYDPMSQIHAIRSGNLFNFLLNQLAGNSALAGYGDLSPMVVAGLPTLDDDALQALQVETGAPGGPIALSLTKPVPDVFEQTPYLLREPAFKPLMEDLRVKSQKLIGAQMDNDSKRIATLEFEAALQRVSSAFYKKYPPGQKGLPMRQWQRIRDADDYFARLDQTMAMLAISEASELKRPVYIDQYPNDQRTLATLAQFMLRNGLRFGECKPGTEFVYDSLFPQFRQLCDRLEIQPNKEWIEGALMDLDLDEVIDDRTKKPGQNRARGGNPEEEVDNKPREFDD